MTAPVGVAVVGCGAWGRNVARALHDCAALSAVCDHHPEVTADLAARFSVPALTFEEILADPATTAVAIVTQPSHHAELASAALEAGKHVFVEKPLAASLEEARRLVGQAERASRILMVGHILRHHPAFEALHAAVRDGRLGRLRHIRSHRFAFGAVRREEDVLACLAPHDISMILALTGERPDRVEARATRSLGREIADTAALHLRFPGGCRADVAVSWLHPFKEQRLVVTGEAGLAVFDDREPWASKLSLVPLTRSACGGPPFAVAGPPETLPVTAAEPLARECRAFLDAVATGRPALTDGVEGLGVMEVLEEARRALEREDVA